MDALREAIRIHKPYLVVIDALRSAHKGDENSSRVAGVLEPLAEIARDTGVAILVIHHLRKLAHGEEVSMDSTRGSNALTAICRSILAIDAPDPEPQEPLAAVVCCKEQHGPETAPHRP